MAEALAAEFARPSELIEAARELTRSRYVILDAFTPYPLPELAELFELPKSPLPLLGLCAGLGGASLTYAVQWYLSVVAYPLNVGGRPLHSAPAFVPLSFELGILSAVIVALVAFFWLGRLGRLWRPEDELSGFGSSSIEHFWLTVEVVPGTASERVQQLLREHGALRVELLEAR